jgi:hypothetical protein
MKKAIVLLLALVVVGALVFAEDAPPATYEFSANATGGWTTNVTQGTSTFINDWDLSLKFHLLNDLTKTTAGEGTYGSIEVTHLNLNLIEETEDSATVGNGAALWTDKNPDDGISVKAKIVSGPIELGLYGAPGDNYENAKYVPLFNKDKGFEGTGDNDSMLKPDIGIAKGLSLKYSFGDLGAITLKAGNTADKAAVTTASSVTVVYTATGSEKADANVTYTDFVGNPVLFSALVKTGIYLKTTVTPVSDLVKGHYSVGGELAINPVKDLVALFAGGWYDLDTKQMIFSTTVKVTAGDLSVGLALDGDKPDGTDLKFDAAANVAYALFEKKDSVNLDFYYANDAVQPTDGATDLGLKFVDAGGLVAPLSFTVGAFYQDLLDSYSYDPKYLSFAESISYKVALSDTTYVKPYEAFWYDMNDSTNKAGMYFNAGVEASLFANTILTADFAYGGKNPDLNEKLTDGNAAKDVVLTFKAKVTL